MFGAETTGLQDLQGCQKLIFEKVVAVTAMGQRGERMDHVIAAHIRTVIGFHTPDGEHDFRLHAITLLHIGKRLAPFSAHGAARRDSCGTDGIAQILPGGVGDFGLALCQFHDAGTGRKARERLLEDRARNAARVRFWPYARNKTLHIAKRDAGQHQACTCAQCHGERLSPRETGIGIQRGNFTHGYTYQVSSSAPPCPAFVA